MTEKELFTKIVNHATKNERIAWKRKHKKLTTIIEDDVQPIEDQILQLIMQKQVYIDKITEIRDILIKECVHPREFLVTKDDHILCKFCNKKLNVND